MSEQMPTATSAEVHLCEHCLTETHEDVVNMALWNEGRLVLIEDVPARVCAECMEQYYDDVTRFRIDKLRAGRFPPSDAKEVIEVPVFSLGDVEDPEDRESSPNDANDRRSAEPTAGTEFTGYESFPDEI